MKTPKWLLLLGVSLLVACGSGDPAPDSDVVGLDQFRTAAAGHRSVDVFVAGADGTRLATYVYLPANGSGPFPTLVMRTPYDLPITPVSGFPEDHANTDLEARAENVGWTEATDRGYALVVQMVRGRYRSDGVFSLFLDEVDDGDALLRWVEKQPWSNGRIGIFGDSASGVVSLQAAASGRPSVQAVYSQATSPDFLGGVIFAGGRIKSEALLPFVLNQSSGNSADHDARLGLTAARIAELKDEAGAALGDMFGAVEAGDPAASSWWTRPLTADLPVVSPLQPRWGDLLAAGRSPAALDALDVTDRIRAPVLHVSLWHDFFQASAFDAYARLQAVRGDQKLIVLDGTHYDVDDPTLWPSRPMFSWFDHHLKDAANGVPGWPAVQYTVSGQAALGMRSSAAWPPAGSTPVVVALAPPLRALVADPATPAPTLGGSHLTISAGMQDQRPLLARADVIELRGTVLSAATLMAGAASAQIDVFEAGAGDVVVKLVERRPDGEVRLLRESVVALSGPGTQRVDFAPLAYAFDAGSAPGLVLAGASLPAFVSQTPALAGSVRVGGARLVLPRLDE